MSDTPSDRALIDELGDPTVDRLDVLIEKSLRSALTDGEQRELGTMLAASPDLNDHAQRAHEEDRSMQALIRNAAEHFDPEIARRAIDNELRMWRRAWRIIPSMIVMTGGFAVVYTAFRSGWTAIDWPLAAGLVALLAILWSVTWYVMLVVARRRATRAMMSDEALEQSYRRQLAGIPKFVLIYRISAIVAVLVTGAPLVGALRDGSGTLFWWIVFLLMLPNLYFAFNRRNIDRVAGSMSGVIDADGATRRAADSADPSHTAPSASDDRPER